MSSLLLALTVTASLAFIRLVYTAFIKLIAERYGYNDYK